MKNIPVCEKKIKASLTGCFVQLVVRDPRSGKNEFNTRRGCLGKIPILECQP